MEHNEKNIELYPILNEYLKDINQYIATTHNNIITVSETIKKFTSNDDINEILINKEHDRLLLLGEIKEELNEKFRIIKKFDISLTQNRENPLFEQMMNHFLEKEKFSYCDLLTKYLLNI